MININYNKQRYLSRHCEFCGAAMSLQLTKCEVASLYDDAYRANMQSRNAIAIL
jgi:hypothetical protein